MDDKENISESDVATLVDNECEPSTDHESSKPSENDKEPIVAFVQPNNKLISYGTNGDKKIISDSEQPAANDQTKKGQATRNFFFVEPLLFLMMFSMMGASVCNKTLYLDKACNVYLKYSSDICNNLTFYTAEGDEAQKVANNFTLYSNLISMIPASMLTIFIGSWSDKYGRKNPILVALMGMVCQDILLFLNSQYLNWPMSYLLLTSLPTALTGSLIAVNTCVYSFSSEKTDKKKRTFKYAILELAMVVGMPSGTFISGRLFQAYSYKAVYSLTLTGHAIGFLYTALTMIDTKTTDGQSIKTLVCDFFSFDSLKENFRTCVKVRENHGRAKIGLLIGSMCIIMLGYIAVGDITYYFCKKMYGWTMTDYSDVSTISIVVVIVMMVILVPLLTRVFRVQDSLLGLLGSLSTLGQNLCRCFAYKEWIYYTSMAVGCFGGFGPLAVRSMLSKVVSADEVGKVFAMLSACESLLPIFGSLLFLEVYNATVGSYPGMAFLCCATLLVFPVITFVVILRWQRPPKCQSMESGIDAVASTSVQ